MGVEHDIALVPIEGDVSVRTAPYLRRMLMSLMEGGTRRIVLNMAEVPYVDSAGLGVIIGCVRTMRERGGLLSLVNVSPNVARSLAYARLVDFCPVSMAGHTREVPDLEPGSLPLWETTLPVDKDNLSAARTRIADLARRLGFDADSLFDITLAAGEAIGNAWDHTSGDDVLATVAGFSDRLIVEIIDSGEGFEVPDAPICRECTDERGRGIALMRLLVDSVSIDARPSGHGTVVRLTKMVGR